MRFSIPFASSREKSSSSSVASAVVPRFVEPSIDVGGASTRVLLRARLNVVAVVAVGGGGGGGDNGDKMSG